MQAFHAADGHSILIQSSPFQADKIIEDTLPQNTLEQHISFMNIQVIFHSEMAIPLEFNYLNHGVRYWYIGVRCTIAAISYLFYFC